MAKIAPAPLSGCPYAHKNMSDVAKHASYFAQSDGKLTNESMVHGHTVQGITKGVGIKIRAIGNLLDDRKKLHTAEDVATVVNGASSGIWGPDGKFNEARFQQLVSRYINDNGKAIITRAMVDEFLHEIHGDKDHGLATKIFLIIPVSWSAITKASFDELFTYYSDHKYTNAEGVTVNALTVNHLRFFYTDPYAFFQSYEKK